MIACSRGDVEILRVHHYAKAGQIEETQGISRRALLQKMAYVCARSGQSDTLFETFVLGAEVDKSTLRAASKCNCARVFSLLVSQHLEHLERDDCDEWVQKTLLRAIVKSNLPLVNISLRHGARLNMDWTRKGHGALALAVIHGPPDVVRYLLGLGALIPGSGALAAAVNYRRYAALEELLTHLEAVYAHRRVVEELGRYSGLEIEDETSALILAVTAMRYRSVRRLLKHGVDPRRANSLGISAMDVAWSMQNREMVNVLDLVDLDAAILLDAALVDSEPETWVEDLSSSSASFAS